MNYSEDLWGRARDITLSPRHVVLLYLVAIALTESATTLLFPQLGLALHGVLLLVLIYHAAYTDERPLGALFLALAFVPLIRLISLSLPLHSVSPIYRYVMVGIPLSIAAILAVRTLQMDLSNLGLNRRTLPIQVLVALTGIGLGYIQYRLLRPDALMADLRWDQVLFAAVILLLVTGFLEEFIFRGIMQSTAVQVLDQWGVVYVAVLYAVMHLGHRSAFEIVFAFGVGLFFGMVTFRTGSIVGVALAHGLMSITVYLIFPLILTAAGT